MATDISKLNISSNSEPAAVTETLKPLTSEGGRWQISATNSGIEREFKFKTFKMAWAFMNKVAEAAQKNKHHPEWSNVGRVPFFTPLLSQVTLFCGHIAEGHFSRNIRGEEGKEGRGDVDMVVIVKS